MSYRTDERWQHSPYQTHYMQFTLYSGDAGFTPVGGGNEMYSIFFYKTDTDTYYSKIQLHFTVDKKDVWYEDRDEVEYSAYTLTCEYWDMIEGSREYSQTVTLFDSVNYNYFHIESLGLIKITGVGFDTYEHFINFQYRNGGKSFLPSGMNVLYKPDMSTSVTLTDNPSSLQMHFKAPYSSHNDTCSFGGLCDFGYLASAAPISTLYNIDTTKIPDNYYVTISNDSSTGDTIYNYTITNPETGQKDTIQNFITNNYTFTTTNEGDTNISGGSGSDGGAGGDVTVGGNVEVGGQVDINVNVNGGNNDNVSLPDTDLVENLPEAPQGFIDYLKKLFDFLPAPVLAIIIAAIAAAVFCRIWGR